MINDADLDGPNLTLPKAMLRRRPDIMVSTELVDMRMYIFSNWVIDYIVENEETISGITEDLLPSLLDMQFRGNQMYVSHALFFLVVDCCVVVLLIAADFMCAWIKRHEEERKKNILYDVPLTHAVFFLFFPHSLA